jgi:hypothetical protein
MLRRVALVTTDVLEEHIPSIIRVTRITSKHAFVPETFENQDKCPFIMKILFETALPDA